MQQLLDSLFKSGELALKLNKLTNALNSFKYIIQISPDSLKALNSIGDIFFRISNYTQATNFYLQAISIADNFHSNYKLAKIYEFSNKWYGALIHCEKCLHLSKKEHKYVALNLIANVYINLGDFKVAFD
mmetsp:Transcript_73977/g.159996  ORF Transcript_73977/g.159996 Transcript_73977/m.159996 type:complete len:130 (+) Transcript_73977:948-1337(+)